MSWLPARSDFGVVVLPQPSKMRDAAGVGPRGSWRTTRAASTRYRIMPVQSTRAQALGRSILQSGGQAADDSNALCEMRGRSTHEQSPLEQAAVIQALAELLVARQPVIRR